MMQAAHQTSSRLSLNCSFGFVHSSLSCLSFVEFVHLVKRLSREREERN